MKENPNSLSLGQRVRRFRLEKGISQQELADLAGCSRSNITKIENDSFTPSVQNLQGIADALGVKLNEMIEFLS